MNFKCAVKNCLNSSKKCDLFASPPDERLNKQWQKAIDTKEFNFYVCENHFYKKDIIHEKTLKDSAIPRLRLQEESFQLENKCCGFCLDDLDDPLEIQNEFKDTFIEITGYAPLTDLMCAHCKLGLMRYKKFVTEIKQKHSDIRNLVSHEVMKNESDDDCMIIDDDDDVVSIKSNESTKINKSAKFKDTKSSSSQSSDNDDDDFNAIDEMLMNEIPKAEFVDIRGIEEILSKNLDSLSDIDLIENEPKKTKPEIKKVQEVLKKQVKCLTCNKEMDVDQLLKHRLSEHPQQGILLKPRLVEHWESKTPSKPRPVKHAEPKIITPKLVQEKKPLKCKRPEEIMCKYCDKQIKSSYYKYHYNALHNDQPPPFLCHVCSKAFFEERLLRDHLRLHDPDLLYTCDLCGVKYLRKDRIRRHLLCQHLNLYIYQDQCKICQQKVARRIKKHMRIYHPDGFDDGMRVNSETNYFDCYKCGASYADLFTYRRHDCEKGRFQIRCNDCQKPVKNLENLQKHQKYKCPKKPRQGVFKESY